MNINSTLKALNKLDWSLAAGTLAVGVYMSNWWLAVGGLVGLLAAWFKPAERIKVRLEKMFLRKKTKTTSDTAVALQEDAFYAQMLGEAQPATACAVPESPRTYTAAVAAGPLHLSQSPYSEIRYHHLNLAAAVQGRNWA